MLLKERLKNTILYSLFLLIEFLSVCMAVGLVMRYEKDSGILYTIIAVLVAVVVFFTVLFVKNIINTIRDRHRMQFYQTERALRDKHYIEMRKQYDTIRRMRHDFYSHVETLETLRERGQSEEVFEYIDSMQKEFEKISAVSFCSIPALDALVYNKVEEAHKKGIRTEIHIGELNRSLMTDYELCSVASNMMQNAIDGADNFSGAEKFMELECYIRSGFFVMKVRNSANKPLPGMKTTKKDCTNHGYGTNIIRNITRNHNGNAVFEYDEKTRTFTCVVNIPAVKGK